MKPQPKFILLAVVIASGLWATSRLQSVINNLGFHRPNDEPNTCPARDNAKPPYVHNVVWYMKEDIPKDEVENLIADAHRLLEKVPSVKGLWIGRPADKERSTPKLAVTDYHVGMLLLFDDSDGLQEYLTHKLHLEFREKHAKHAERVLVYDFVNQPK